MPSSISRYSTSASDSSLLRAPNRSSTWAKASFKYDMFCSICKSCSFSCLDLISSSCCCCLRLASSLALCSDCNRSSSSLLALNSASSLARCSITRRSSNSFISASSFAFSSNNNRSSFSSHSLNFASSSSLCLRSSAKRSTSSFCRRSFSASSSFAFCSIRTCSIILSSSAFLSAAIIRICNCICNAASSFASCSNRNRSSSSLALCSASSLALCSSSAKRCSCCCCALYSASRLSFSIFCRLKTSINASVEGKSDSSSSDCCDMYRRVECRPLGCFIPNI
mmetsp:Transcript_36293/g.53355  ORF Transcript_36293/g.53355 Transcript_36293/m.53355 type:complete len:282 (+) Transcript_36293:302-1147(+)